MNNSKDHLSINTLHVTLDKGELDSFDFINLPITILDKVVGVTTSVEDLGEKVKVEISLSEYIIPRIMKLDDKMIPDTVYLSMELKGDYINE